jgi:hypothetical protein
MDDIDVSEKKENPFTSPSPVFIYGFLRLSKNQSSPQIPTWTF